MLPARFKLHLLGTLSPDIDFEGRLIMVDEMRDQAFVTMAKLGLTADEVNAQIHRNTPWVVQDAGRVFLPTNWVAETFPQHKDICKSIDDAVRKEETIPVPV